MAKNYRQQNRFLASYAINHLRSFIGSLGHISRQPLASLMTCTVIAIALTLPAGMFLILDNLNHMGSKWDNSAQISLFLHLKTNEVQANSFANRIRLHKKVATVKVISKDQGLEQFQQQSGFGDALKFLDKNPLPIVISVQPVAGSTNSDGLADLVAELQKNKLVDVAQLDIQWVKRLYSIMEVAKRGIWIVGGLLAIAVLLTIGNTIRLDIQNRKQEIKVARLVGASDAFIRRPFLYTGFWYGVSGGLLAWLLTVLSISLLSDPVNDLTGLYNSGFELTGLGFYNVCLLIGFSCFLGLAGSWLAVGRHLSEIEPS